MRLIDADAIYSEMKDYYFTHRDEHDASWEGGFGKCMNMIPKAPTSDLQPRKGKWICQVDDDIFNCSECDYEIDGTGCIDPFEYLKTYNFCPNCGAKMVRNVKDKSTDTEKSK